MTYLGFAFLYDDNAIKNNNLVVLSYLKKVYREFTLAKTDSEHEGMIKACNILGSYYSNTNNYKKDKFYFNKAIIISKKVKCPRSIIHGIEWGNYTKT